MVTDLALRIDGPDGPNDRLGVVGKNRLVVPVIALQRKSASVESQKLNPRYAWEGGGLARTLGSPSCDFTSKGRGLRLEEGVQMCMNLPVSHHGEIVYDG